ncbi:Transient receptor potential channel pyrexia [Orchesella cincta]|uniref:Transient receptor potential channel pyrexia n=1 Tax=Orchesella cincta TaxID=48709 RepID=A0A1D2M0Y5_ORCCI|nr:Transient receptor potential channel pyrexia [Orchesella cincta]
MLNQFVDCIRGGILRFITKDEEKTVLHEICDCVDQENARAMLHNVLSTLQDLNHPEIVNKIFIETKDKNGYTALDYALQRRNLDAFWKLTEHGANTYVKYLSEQIRGGNFDILRQFVDDMGEDILEAATTDEGRNFLHDVCDCENITEAKRMLDKVLLCYEGCRLVNDNTFLNKQDKYGNTALHYAIKRNNRYAVRALINLEADLLIANKEHKEAITGIYQMFPKSILTWLDGRHRNELNNPIQFGSKVIEDDDDKNREITCNFGFITGVDVDRTKVYETYNLSHLLNLKKDVQATILEYPIVQLFLDLKWNRMYLLVYFSTLFHMTWSVISCGVIWHIFMIKYGNGTNTTEKWNYVENKSWQLFPEDESEAAFGSGTAASSVILHVFTAVMVIKELIEAKSTPTYAIYINQIENWGQLLLIISIYLLQLNLILSELLPTWLDYNLSIVPVTTSCLLIFGQLNKNPKLSLYLEMFRESLKDFGLLFLLFSPILFAFNLGFRMVMPLNEEFHLWPPWGLIKIEAMSTGEFNYDGIYDHEVVAIKVPKNLLILAFIIMVSVVLTNLLIGLFVSDVKNLKDRARVCRFRTQLEQMFLMEAFITHWWPGLAQACRVTESRSMMSLCPCKCSGDKIEEILNEFWESCIVSEVRAGEQELKKSHIVTKTMKEFSEESKIRLIELKTERDNSKKKVCPSPN